MGATEPAGGGEICEGSVSKQEQPCRIERDLPGLRQNAQGAPKLFWDIGLQVVRLTGFGRSVQAEVESHLMRGLAGGDEPAREGVCLVRICLEKDLV